VPAALSPEINLPGMKLTTHNSTAEVKNTWSCTSTPEYVSMAWCFIKLRIHVHGVLLS
jgi:hypothetical protein